MVTTRGAVRTTQARGRHKWLAYSVKVPPDGLTVLACVDPSVCFGWQALEGRAGLEKEAGVDWKLIITTDSGHQAEGILMGPEVESEC